MIRMIVVALFLFAAIARGFELSSPDFRDGGNLPKLFTCDSPESGFSPELDWKNSPKGTQFYYLAVFDESPFGLFNHWLVTGIPAEVHHLARAANKNMPSGATTKYSYIPACPPVGEVRTYKFELYALSKKIELSDDLVKALSELKSHALGVASITAKYGESKGTHAHVPHTSHFETRSIEAVFADGDGGGVFNPTKTVNLPSTSNNDVSMTGPTAFIFGTTPVLAPAAGAFAKIRVVFTISLGQGDDVCCNAGILNSSPLGGSSSAIGTKPQHCTAAGKKLLTFGRTIQLKNTDDLNLKPFAVCSFLPALKRQSLAAAQLGLSFTVQQQTDPQPSDLTVLAASDLGVAKQYFLPSIANTRIIAYPDDMELPNIPQGTQALVSVTANILVGAADVTDNFNVCFGGSFGTYALTLQGVTNQGGSTICKPANTPAFPLSWSQIFDRGVLPSVPYILVTGTAKTRNVLSTAFTLTPNALSLTQYQPGVSAGTGNVQFNFVFANMFVVQKS